MPKTDSKMRTIEKGYRNISIGTDHAMICSSPKLAVKNDRKLVNPSQT